MARAKDINLFGVLMTPEASAGAARVLHSGYIGQGRLVDQFEAALAERLATPRVVTTNSGTSALHLALHLLRAPNRDDGWPGLAPGDEVITTPLTCVATNWPILAHGLTPRWADTDAGDCNVSLDSIGGLFSPRTKIIIVVHWGGAPVDLERLDHLVDEAEARFGFRPAVIEDCAHAFGSRLHGRPIGASSNYCAFSFQAVKTLTCGDGGALTLPADGPHQRARRLRWYGIDRDAETPASYHERDVAEWGFKFHMNDINAAIGLGNLGAVDGALAAQRSHAARYDAALAGCPGVTLPVRHPGHESSHYLYTIRVERRAAFQAALRGRGIEARRVHARNDWHSCAAPYRSSSLPELDRIYDQIVCVPVGWWLTDDEVDHVITSITAGW